MSGIVDRMIEIERKVAEIERRGRNRKRTGTVTEVDNAKGLARVKISDGEGGAPFLTGWLPWKEVASGGIKSHIPPTSGEQVDVVSESGDLTDALIDMSSPSNSNPRPHNGPEAVITKGAVRITVGDAAVDIVGKLDVTGDVTVKGVVAITGSSVTHNSKNIGSTHKHVDVESGDRLSGVPD